MRILLPLTGSGGGTGAAPARIRDHVGIPIELALASVDERLRSEGIRNCVSLVAGGSIRSSSDVVKAIALGADAVYIATGRCLRWGAICAVAAIVASVTGELQPKTGAGQTAESQCWLSKAGQSDYCVEP